MSELVRYSTIDEGMKREFLLLQGKGCAWRKCTFCDYYLDSSSDPFVINEPVLDMVSGKYGVLDIINSGSAMELDERTLEKIAVTVREKKISDLWFEAHWMYRHSLAGFAEQFDCRVHYRIGVETFNPDLRLKWKKGIGRDVTAEEIRRYFDGICLLAGVKGQTLEDIKTSVETAERLFDYYSVNLFCPNSSQEERDDELADAFIREIVPSLRKSRKAEILIDNTDLGVG